MANVKLIAVVLAVIALSANGTKKPTKAPATKQSSGGGSKIKSPLIAFKGKFEKTDDVKEVAEFYKQAVPADKDNVKKIVHPLKMPFIGATYYITGVERKDGSGCVVMFTVPLVKYGAHVHLERGPECAKNQTYELIKKWTNGPIKVRFNPRKITPGRVTKS